MLSAQRQPVQAYAPAGYARRSPGYVANPGESRKSSKWHLPLDAARGLLLRTRDRYSAAGLLDRLLPPPARKAVWSRLRPGIPGPFPPVYEKAVCDQGIASYTLMRGLVIAARGAELTLPERPARLSSSVRITCAAISRLTRGRFGDNHDELLYVIRKPQDRFARVV